MYNRSLFLLFLFLAVVFLPFPGPVGAQQDKKYVPHKPLEYEVSVRAQILPVFAVDKHEEPVYDLKRRDLELYVNGKPHKITMFTRFKFIDHRKREHVIKRPERVNFIIIDSFLNKRKGLKRALEIARLLVNKGARGDSFVIFESSQNTGFRYVAGPDKDKTRLTAAIDGILTAVDKHQVHLKPFPKYLPPGENEARFAIRMYQLENKEININRMEYRREVQVFSQTLGQLKYALKTITKPKSVFLISAGMEKGVMGVGKSRYYKFLQEAAKAINYGGSMLYIINPVELRSKRTVDNLKFMADTSGGKYFINTDIKKLVKEIKKSTAAYYEVAFFPAKDSGDEIRIQLKSKRKGISIYTVNYSERGKPYKEMETTQKKLFALNVIFKGSWSRIVGRVAQIKFKELENQNPGTKTIELKLPPHMNSQAADLFLVEVDPRTYKSEVDMRKIVLKETEKIDIPVKKDRDHYFVIVEPKKTFCLYNQAAKVPVPVEAPAGARE